MIDLIKSNLTSDRLALRIATTYVIFLVIFFLVTIASYFLLPEGFLRNKHPLQTWETTPNLLVSTLQIFSYNLISVVMIVVANLFAMKKKSKCFMPLGYTAFFVMITLNAVVLGTWSFSVITSPVPLLDRLVRTFDIFHRAGLWEMSGQLLILCATAKIALVLTEGKETKTKNWKTIRLSKQEWIATCVGLILMAVGALIESYGIMNLA